MAPKVTLVGTLGEAELRALIVEHRTWPLAARAIGVNVSSLRNRASDLGIKLRDVLDDHEIGIDGSTKVILSDDSANWGDIRALLEDRSLSVNDWLVTRARVNEWGGSDGKDNQQLRIDLAPRMGALMPARCDGWVAPPRVKATDRDSELVVFLGDHHAPHHDPALHLAVCEWLREFKPDRGIILGDLLDYDQLSRHRRTPEWTAGVQETLDSGYAILRAYVEASPNTAWSMLDGNHEARLRNSVLDNLSSLFGVKRARVPDEAPTDAVLSTPFLLRLDELGVAWESPDGGYENAQIKVTSELAARHGWVVKKGSGASALTSIDRLRYSVVIGHTHRQAIVHHTAHSIDGKPKTLLGCEAGTLASIEGGLGYATSPDWQRGFATATIYNSDDVAGQGIFKVDLATYVDGLLLWRDWHCRP